ncbi:MAG: N-acetyl-gamma-glutamyl-phosphate reductase [Methylacidiphilales bacterium]|nr:N-acetyl-gamma-glutamyl-phosphate reductase [Candidatus Methylacidiphilales bacterium]
MGKSIQVGIVGARGYTGAECLRLLTGHPEFTVSVVCSTTIAGKTIASVFPSLSLADTSLAQLNFSSYSPEALKQCQVVIFTTPHGVAASLVPALLELGIRVVDLSADFRLRDPSVWQQYYHSEHPNFALVKQACYGLTEYEREKITSAQLVANPGCYPTAVSLALIPLLREQCISAQGIIADCKSGVSGAGRKVEEGYLLSELRSNFFAYGLPAHRHLPEIEQGLTQYGCLEEGALGITFVPHLLPVPRGILATLYCQSKLPLQQVYQVLQASYHHEPFVKVLPLGELPQLVQVVGTNLCAIGLSQTPQGTLVIVSAIDNMIKGAAGQALQNMNRMFGFEETLGLSAIPLWP